MPTKAAMRCLIAGAAALIVTAFSVSLNGTAMADSQVKAVVNNIAITNNDIARRVSFLRLRRTGGNLAEKAREELVNEVLEREEIIRTGMSVSTEDVNAAFARFAGNNNMSPEQLTKLLAQAGVGADHFKAYIGVSMSWPRVVNARYGGSQKMSNDDLVARLKANNGQKPTSTEYILQQMIFVIPEARRGKITGKRKSEAQASRSKYPGCENGKIFAATMHDVSVRNLGRFLTQELPANWKDEIEKTEQGGTTPIQVTDKGVEYIAVCKKREVSDDLAAEMVFGAQDLAKAEAANADPKSQKYLDELRKKAQIVMR